MLFKRIRAATLTEKVRSRDGCIYMYRAMRVVGWVPPKRLRVLYHIWTALTFIFSVTYLPIGFIGSYILNISQFTPGEFLTSLQAAFNACGSSVKCVITFSQLWRFEKAMKILDKLDEHCVSKSELLTIRRIVARSNYAFLIFTFVYCGYAGSTFLSSTFSGRAPWQLYNPVWDWRQDTLHLWMEAWFEYLVISGAVMQDQLADSFPLVFMIIIRAHLEVLKERIENLRMDSTKTQEEHYQELVNCIIDHKHILEYCNIFRPVISITTFIQFLLCGIVLGLTLINMYFFSDMWTGMASLMFVITIVMQTFPFCYCCNLIVEDCDNLTNAIFQSNWCDADSRYRSTLLYFLHNVQQPIIFMAMGIFQIGLSSNISVAKFAFSVITIANQMNLAERFQ